MSTPCPYEPPGHAPLDELGRFGQVGARVEPEPSRPAVRPRGPVLALEVLPFVFKGIRVVEAAHLGVAAEDLVKH
jgi:hypothetical protein